MSDAVNSLRRTLQKRRCMSAREFVVGARRTRADACATSGRAGKRRPRVGAARRCRPSTTRQDVVSHWLSLPPAARQAKMCFTERFPKLVQSIWQLNVNLLCAGLFQQASAVAVSNARRAGAISAHSRHESGDGRAAASCSGSVPGQNAAQQFPLLEAVEFTNEGSGTLAVKPSALADPAGFMALVDECVAALLGDVELCPHDVFTRRFVEAARRCDTWTGLQELVGTLVERAILETFYEELDTRAQACMAALCEAEEEEQVKRAAAGEGGTQQRRARRGRRNRRQRTKKSRKPRKSVNECNVDVAIQRGEGVAPCGSPAGSGEPAAVGPCPASPPSPCFTSPQGCRSPSRGRLRVADEKAQHGPDAVSVGDGVGSATFTECSPALHAPPALRRVPYKCQVRLSDVASPRRGYRPSVVPQTKPLVVSVAESDQPLSTSLGSVSQLGAAGRPASAFRSPRCFPPPKSWSGEVGRISYDPNTVDELPADLQAKLEETYRVTARMVGHVVGDDTAPCDKDDAGPPSDTIGLAPRGKFLSRLRATASEFVGRPTSLYHAHLAMNDDRVPRRADGPLAADGVAVSHPPFPPAHSFLWHPNHAMADPRVDLERARLEQLAYPWVPAQLADPLHGGVASLWRPSAAAEAGRTAWLGAHGML